MRAKEITASKTGELCGKLESDPVTRMGLPPEP